MDTPAFVPLATKAPVRSLEAREVAGLGYELVLGNTYYLLSPGPERIAKLGGLHRFMGWERVIVTDSGGFRRAPTRWRPRSTSTQCIEQVRSPRASRC